MNGPWGLNGMDKLGRTGVVKSKHNVWIGKFLQAIKAFKTVIR